MADSFLTELGSGTATTGNTVELTTTAAVVSGDTITVAVAGSDTDGTYQVDQGDPLGTVTDQAGNEYTLQDYNAVVSLSGILYLAVYTCVGASGLASGSWIRFTSGGRYSGPYKSIQAHSASGIVGVQTRGVVTKAGSNSATPYSGYVTIPYLPAPAPANAYVVGYAAWKKVNGPNADDVTIPSDWTRLSGITHGGGLRLKGAHRAVTLRGSYQYDLVLPQAATQWVGFILAYELLPPPIEIFIQEELSFSEGLSLNYGARTVTVTESLLFSDSVGQDGGGTVPGSPQEVTPTETLFLYERVLVRDGSLTERTRVGARVPEGGITLAWLQIPGLAPTENLSLVDTARFIAENIDVVWQEALPSGVGYLDAEAGWLHKTVYNPSAESLSGVLNDGPATYDVRRAPDAASQEPAWSIQQFTRQIQVLHPRDLGVGMPWYPLLRDGLVIRRYLMRANDASWLAQFFSEGDELVLYYSLVEAQDLPFDSDNRTLQVTLPITEIDGNRLQFPFPDLWEVTSLKVNDQELVTGAALTRDADPETPFESWEPEAGRVLLTRFLDSNDRVEATFRYQEAYYVYRGYYDEEAGRYRDLNLNPEPGHTYDGGRDTAELLDRTVFLYLLPTAAYRRSYLDSNGVRNYEPDRVLYTGTRFTRSFLRWQVGGFRNDDSLAPSGEEPEGPPDLPEQDPCQKRSTFGYVTFAKAYYVDQVPRDPQLPPPITPGGDTAGGLAGIPSALLLAKIYVTPNSQVENLQVLDARVRGGGVPVTVNPGSALLPGSTRRQVETYWDIGGWDGQPVSLAGSLLLELPSGVRDGTNGYQQFTEEEIERIVRSRVAAGIRVVTRYG